MQKKAYIVPMDRYDLIEAIQDNKHLQNIQERTIGITLMELEK